MKWIIFIIVAMSLGVVEASPSVDIAYPTNDTLFNRTVALNVSSNETIATWYYSLDGGANTTFTPNISIVMARGAHNISVTADNGTVNNTGTVYFTTAYILVKVLNLETEANVSSGISTKILTTGDVTLASNTTNASGMNYYEGIGYGSYKVQAGGPAGTSYPYIFTYSFTSSVPITDLEVYLSESTACQYVAYQYVDSFYKTPLDSVSITLYKSTRLLTESTTTTNGFVTICLVPGLGYIFESSKTNYVTANLTDTAALTSQYMQMVRTTFVTVTEAAISMRTYPEESIFYKNDTIFFGMWISDSESQLSEYGIIYGRSPKVIKDDSIQADNPLFKYKVASGSNSAGEYLTCLDGRKCLNINDWKSSEIYVGYYYRRTGEDKVWKVNKKTVDIGTPTRENWYTNYTYSHDPREAIARLFASVGYGSGIVGEPSMGMITFSMFMMVLATAGAAKKGWGIMGAMVTFFAVNIIMVVFGLIWWWSLVVSGILIGFLTSKFGELFT